MFLKRSSVLLAAIAAMGFASWTNAAVITFGPPTTFSGDSDISNPAGSSVISAITYDGTNGTTVNGVTFTDLNGGASPITSGNTKLATSGGGNLNNGSPSPGAGTYGSTSAPFASLSAGLKSLLGNGVYNDGQNFTLTYTGLTIGQAYQFESLVNDSRGPYSGRSQTITSGGGNSATLHYASAAGAGQVGQYTIGTFVADSTTQVISYTSTNAQLNATILEAVTPEPASLSLLALASAGLLTRRRRRA